MAVEPKKFPLYVFDEPAIYDKFYAGINTDPSNEHLVEGEMRDALNMHYSSGALIKRRGASKLTEIVSPEHITNVQGVFLFTLNITYLILAADGKLFSGVYAKNRTTLERLHIYAARENAHFLLDPTNPSAGLEVLSEGLSIQHTGYILESPHPVLNYYTKELIFQNTRGIEGATYNNILYLTTGTRIVSVRVIDGALNATILQPRILSNTEVDVIGMNYLSPYPELARQTIYNQVQTSISVVSTIPLIGGTFLLQPIMTFFDSEDEYDYFFKWEKRINNEWVVIHSFKDNSATHVDPITGEKTVERFNFYTIEVTDADTHLYRCSFTNNFAVVEDIEEDTIELKTKPIRKYYPETDTTEDSTDYVIDKLEGYFGQASSVRRDGNTQVNDFFLQIQTCHKVVGDGNKLLFYDDIYNSGSWFKTVIDRPEYATKKGSLQFKTDKNEQVLKVIPFNNNLVVFAYSKDLGGSIHLVTGNGDDFPDDFYSPFRRRVISPTITSDNPKTILVAETKLFFKYFDTIYYIEGNDLNQETVQIHSANDRIKQDSRDVKIPWNDNNCIAEVTYDYYAIIWPEKYVLEDKELVLQRPGIRVKLYYKQSFRYEGKLYFPWLRDESKYFSTKHIIYLEGQPLYLYNNVLIAWHLPEYTDFGEIYLNKIRLKAEHLNYPQMFKTLVNVLLFYQRDQHEEIDFDLEVRNEAGHLLIDSRDKRKSSQSLKALKTGQRYDPDKKLRVDSTIQDTKLFPVAYGFPCLLAEAIITAKTAREFSLASITFNYTTLDIPETNPYDLYSKILRRGK